MLTPYWVMLWAHFFNKKKCCFIHVSLMFCVQNSISHQNRPISCKTSIIRNFLAQPNVSFKKSEKNSVMGTLTHLYQCWNLVSTLDTNGALANVNMIHDMIRRIILLWSWAYIYIVGKERQALYLHSSWYLIKSCKRRRKKKLGKEDLLHTTVPLVHPQKYLEISSM